MKKHRGFSTLLILISVITILISCDNEVANSNRNNDSNNNDNDSNDNSGGSGNNSASYTVTLSNLSTQFGDFVIYQTIPEQERNSKLYSIVWMRARLSEGQQHLFKWDTKYSLMWADTKSLVVGTSIDNATKAIKAVSPNDITKNTLTLIKKNGGFLFDNFSTDGQHGILTIKTANTIPNNIASAGVAMDNKSVILMNVFLNMTYKFTPDSTYWIVFGNFNEAEILDTNNIHSRNKNFFSEPMKIVFPINVDDIFIVFKEDNSFEIIQP